jgi:hypothetical protein
MGKTDIIVPVNLTDHDDLPGSIAMAVNFLRAGGGWVTILFTTRCMPADADRHLNAALAVFSGFEDAKEYKIESKTIKIPENSDLVLGRIDFQKMK